MLFVATAIALIRFKTSTRLYSGLGDHGQQNTARHHMSPEQSAMSPLSLKYRCTWTEMRARQLGEPSATEKQQLELKRTTLCARAVKK